MIGVAVDVLGVLLGTLIGMGLGKGINERMNVTLMQGMGHSYWCKNGSHRRGRPHRYCEHRRWVCYR